MKRICLFALSLFTIATGLSAQHCPFDGGSIVVIKLTGADGKPVTGLASGPCLIETDKPYPDSCTYASGLLSLPFDIPQKNLVEKFEGSWQNRAAVYLKSCEFNQPGYYVVVLTQAQRHCMIKKGNDFNYDQRSFEIRLTSEEGNGLVRQVPEKSIYSLCTGSGSWSRIRPIEIKLSE